MKPLFLLLIVFFVAASVCRVVGGNWEWMISGNIAMCLMLCFTALGHFLFTDGMTLMIPAFVPYRRQLVYLTGFAEIAMGVALLFPGMRHTVGIVLLVFLVLVLPANIYAALAHINYETGASDGKGADYLWVRVPMQIFFITWVSYFSVSA